MDTSEVLRKRIHQAEDLQSVVKTMKGLAAVRIRQYERAVEALEGYNRAMRLGFHILMLHRPEGGAQRPSVEKGRLLAIVFGSDQGMVGGLNREIAEYAVSELSSQEAFPKERLVAAVGARVFAELKGAGEEVARLFPLPNSAAGITGIVQELLLQIEQWREEQDVSHVVLFYQHPALGAAYDPRTIQLLPVNLEWLGDLPDEEWPTRQYPAIFQDWYQAFGDLIRQYLFGELFRAFADSLASENASRLASMQAAEKNIDERIDSLNNRFHQQRQSSITEELLDVVAGFEALKG